MAFQPSSISKHFISIAIVFCCILTITNAIELKMDFQTIGLREALQLNRSLITCDYGIENLRILAMRLKMWEQIMRKFYHLEKDLTTLITTQQLVQQEKQTIYSLKVKDFSMIDVQNGTQHDSCWQIANETLPEYYFKILVEPQVMKKNKICDYLDYQLVKLIGDYKFLKENKNVINYYIQDMQKFQAMFTQDNEELSCGEIILSPTYKIVILPPKPVPPEGKRLESSVIQDIPFVKQFKDYNISNSTDYFKRMKSDVKSSEYSTINDYAAQKNMKSGSISQIKSEDEEGSRIKSSDYFNQTTEKQTQQRQFQSAQIGRQDDMIYQGSNVRSSSDLISDKSKEGLQQLNKAEFGWQQPPSYIDSSGVKSADISDDKVYKFQKGQVENTYTEGSNVKSTDYSDQTSFKFQQAGVEDVVFQGSNVKSTSYSDQNTFKFEKYNLEDVNLLGSGVKSTTYSDIDSFKFKQAVVQNVDVEGSNIKSTDFDSTTAQQQNYSKVQVFETESSGSQVKSAVYQDEPNLGLTLESISIKRGKSGYSTLAESGRTSYYKDGSNYTSYEQEDMILEGSRIKSVDYKATMKEQSEINSMDIADTVEQGSRVKSIDYKGTLQNDGINSIEQIEQPIGSRIKSTDLTEDENAPKNLLKGVDIQTIIDRSSDSNVTSVQVIDVVQPKSDINSLDIMPDKPPRPQSKISSGKTKTSTPGSAVLSTDIESTLPEDGSRIKSTVIEDTADISKNLLGSVEIIEQPIGSLVKSVDLNKQKDLSSLVNSVDMDFAVPQRNASKIASGINGEIKNGSKVSSLTCEDDPDKQKQGSQVNSADISDERGLKIASNVNSLTIEQSGIIRNQSKISSAITVDNRPGSAVNSFDLDLKPKESFESNIKSVDIYSKYPQSKSEIESLNVEIIKSDDGSNIQSSQLQNEVKVKSQILSVDIDWLVPPPKPSDINAGLTSKHLNGSQINSLGYANSDKLITEAGSQAQSASMNDEIVPGTLSTSVKSATKHIKSVSIDNQKDSEGSSVLSVDMDSTVIPANIKSGDIDLIVQPRKGSDLQSGQNRPQQDVTRVKSLEFTNLTQAEEKQQYVASVGFNNQPSVIPSKVSSVLLDDQTSINGSNILSSQISSKVSQGPSQVDSIFLDYIIPPQKPSGISAGLTSSHGQPGNYQSLQIDSQQNVAEEGTRVMSADFEDLVQPQKSFVNSVSMESSKIIKTSSISSGSIVSSIPGSAVNSFETIDMPFNNYESNVKSADIEGKEIKNNLGSVNIEDSNLFYSNVKSSSIHSTLNTDDLSKINSLSVDYIVPPKIESKVSSGTTLGYKEGSQINSIDQNNMINQNQFDSNIKSAAVIEEIKESNQIGSINSVAVQDKVSSEDGSKVASSQVMDRQTEVKNGVNSIIVDYIVPPVKESEVYSGKTVSYKVGGSANSVDSIDKQRNAEVGSYVFSGQLDDPSKELTSKINSVSYESTIKIKESKVNSAKNEKVKIGSDVKSNDFFSTDNKSEQSNVKSADISQVSGESSLVNSININDSKSEFSQVKSVGLITDENSNQKSNVNSVYVDYIVPPIVASEVSSGQSSGYKQGSTANSAEIKDFRSTGLGSLVSSTTIEDAQKNSASQGINSISVVSADSAKQSKISSAQSETSIEGSNILQTELIDPKTTSSNIKSADFKLEQGQPSFINSIKSESSVEQAKGSGITSANQESFKTGGQYNSVVAETIPARVDSEGSQISSVKIQGTITKEASDVNSIAFEDPILNRKNSQIASGQESSGKAGTEAKSAEQITTSSFYSEQQSNIMSASISSSSTAKEANGVNSVYIDYIVPQIVETGAYSGQSSKFKQGSSIKSVESQSKQQEIQEQKAKSATLTSIDLSDNQDFNSIYINEAYDPQSHIKSVDIISDNPKNYLNSVSLEDTKQRKPVDSNIRSAHQQIFKEGYVYSIKVDTIARYDDQEGSKILSSKLESTSGENKLGSVYMDLPDQKKVLVGSGVTESYKAGNNANSADIIEYKFKDDKNILGVLSVDVIDSQKKDSVINSISLEPLIDIMKISSKINSGEEGNAQSGKDIKSTEIINPPSLGYSMVRSSDVLDKDEQQKVLSIEYEGGQKSSNAQVSSGKVEFFQPGSSINSAVIDGKFSAPVTSQIESSDIKDLAADNTFNSIGMDGTKPDQVKKKGIASAVQEYNIEGDKINSAVIDGKESKSNLEIDFVRSSTINDVVNKNVVNSISLDYQNIQKMMGINSAQQDSNIAGSQTNSADIINVQEVNEYGSSVNSASINNDIIQKVNSINSIDIGQSQIIKNSKIQSGNQENNVGSQINSGDIIQTITEQGSQIQSVEAETLIQTSQINSLQIDQSKIVKPSNIASGHEQKIVQTVIKSADLQQDKILVVSDDKPDTDLIQIKINEQEKEQKEDFIKVKFRKQKKVDEELTDSNSDQFNMTEQNKRFKLNTGSQMIQMNDKIEQTKQILENKDQNLELMQYDVDKYWNKIRHIEQVQRRVKFRNMRREKPVLNF